MFETTRIQESTNVRHVEIHPVLTSTNDRAIELIRQAEISFPALIVALQQTAGRGQRSRKWWSGPGSLTFSWIPAFVETGGRFERGNRLLPVTTALAVANAIEALTDVKGIEIKWPNDLLVSGRKICGILIETVSIGSMMGIAVGIGINVNNQEISAAHVDSSEIRIGKFAPTSILNQAGQSTPLEELLIAIVVQLESEFGTTMTNPDSTVKRCNQRLAFAGQKVNFVSPTGQNSQVTCQRITRDGGLVCDSEEGLVTFYSGEISEF